MCDERMVPAWAGMHPEALRRPLSVFVKQRVKRRALEASSRVSLAFAAAFGGPWFAMRSCVHLDALGLATIIRGR